MKVFSRVFVVALLFVVIVHGATSELRPDAARALQMRPGTDLDSSVEGALWQMTGVVTAGDGYEGDFFGGAAALQVNTAVLGASGSAYLFTRTPAGWSQQQKLAADDEDARAFGDAVALDGETAVVGACYSEIDGREGVGAAYVFTRKADVWHKQQRLVPSDREMLGFFAESVAIDGGTILIGAHGLVHQLRDEERAFVFTRSSDTWEEQARLVAEDGMVADLFGAAVALQGDTALIGAPGALYYSDEESVYIFKGRGSSWREQQILQVSEPYNNNNFGSAIALHGDTAIIGAPSSEINGKDGQGAVYVFTRQGDVWREQQKLVARTGAENDGFGSAVALDGNTAIITAPGANVGDLENQGAAYVFVRKGTTWSLQQILLAPHGAANDLFGASAALYRNTAVIGAVGPWDENQIQGKAYFFERRYEPRAYLPLFMPGS